MQRQCYYDNGHSKSLFLFVLLFLLNEMNVAAAFVGQSLLSNSPMIQPAVFNHQSSTIRPPKVMSSSLQLLPSSSSSIIQSSIEIFDGSTIVDPVVVSSVFWNRLKINVLSLFIGNILAIGVFAILTLVFQNQLQTLSTFVSTTVFQQQQQDTPPTYSNNSSKRSRNKQAAVSVNIPKLLLCIVIDVIGTSSELVPVLGEVTDVVWAPIAAVVLRQLFDNSNVVFLLEFVEEILPFTDVLPLATICWCIETYLYDSDLATILQIGQSRTSDAIDVTTVTAMDTKKKER